MGSTTRDRWAEWLAERRFGGDPQIRAEVLAKLAETRDRVLDRADLRKGDTLVLVDPASQSAEGAGGTAKARLFISALPGGPEQPADRENFARVTFSQIAGIKDVQLQDAGQLRIASQPGYQTLAKAKDAGTGTDVMVVQWLRFGSGERRDSGFVGYPTDGLGETTAKLHALYDAIQPPDSDPMLDFDERDLLQLAEEAGFSPIRLTLDARIESVEPRNWDSFVDTAWNPNVPTLREAMEQALSPDEREQLTVQLRTLVERGEGEWRMAFAQLSAVRP